MKQAAPSRAGSSERLHLHPVSSLISRSPSTTSAASFVEEALFVRAAASLHLFPQEQTFSLLQPLTRPRCRYPLGSSFTPCKSSAQHTVPPCDFPAPSALFIAHHARSHDPAPSRPHCHLARLPLPRLLAARSAYSPPCWQKPHTDRSSRSRLNLTTTTPAQCPDRHFSTPTPSSTGRPP